MWTNKKHPKRKYHGSYQWDQNDERIFVLSCDLKSGRIHNVTFESWQMAKQMGWVKK